MSKVLLGCHHVSKTDWVRGYVIELHTLSPLEVQLILHGLKPQPSNDMVSLITTNYLGTVNSKILLSLWKFQDTSQEPGGKTSQLFIIQDSVQFSSVAQLCSTLWPHGCSTPGSPVHHPELAQTHVHRVGDAIQPSHSLLSPSPPAFSLSQHRAVFQGVSASHKVAKVLEFHLQHQSFQWIFRTDFP